MIGEAVSQLFQSYYILYPFQVLGSFATVCPGRVYSFLNISKIRYILSIT
jgi:hypothetical protein